MAWAADVLVYAPEGAPSPGGRVPIEVSLLDGNEPAPGATVEIAAAHGRVVASDGEVAPGRWRFRYEAGPDAVEDRISVRVDGGVPIERVLTVRPFAPARLTAPADVEAPVGTPRIVLRFGLEPGTPPPRAADLLVRTSEGRVLSTEVHDDSVLVAVEPGNERVAHVIAVAVLDARRPDERPVFGLVRLRARPQFTLTTDPGASVTLKVGRRSYGPFVADTAGNVAVSFDALPGESSYELSVSDDLGNTRRTQGPLATSPRPVLVGVEAPAAGSAGARLYLGAWSPAGAIWTGSAPTCVSGDGVRGDAVPVGRGAWSYTVAPPRAPVSLFDAQVGCSVAEASTTLRVATGAPRPERVELRAYPDTLSADFPIAQVQASLLDDRGEPLPPDRLRLTAEAGEIAAEPRYGSLRGEYRGAAAVSRGGDRLTAAWDEPAGEGEPWSIELYGKFDAGDLLVEARVRDAARRPLGGVEVSIGAGESADVASTDARGWARVSLPVGPEPTILRASSGEAGAEAIVLPGAETDFPDPSRPDLSAVLELPIRAGRVRAVYIDASPRPLLTGAGQTAVVTVRMLDAAGTPVRDEPVQIEADAGSVGTPVTRADGSLEATYTPPPGPLARTVRITAATSAGRYQTDLELVPRPVHGSIGIGAGWVSNFGTLSSPTFQIVASTRLPILPDVLQSRIAVGAYALHRTDVAGLDLSVSAQMLPIELGIQGVQRSGTRVIQAGLSALIVPFHLSEDCGTARCIDGVAVAPPGLALFAGGAKRLGNSEIYGEARYLVYTVSTPNVGFEGSLGGLSLTAGYRVLY